jgi:hypothetical protein
MTEQSGSQTKGQGLRSETGDKRSVFATINVSGAILTENSLFAMMGQFLVSPMFSRPPFAYALCAAIILACVFECATRICGNGDAAAEMGRAVDVWSLR